MDVRIIGAPMDLGASRRGTDMGPSAIRVARLAPRLTRLGHDVEDLGNVISPTVETKTVKHTGLLYLDEIVEVCEALADRVHDVVSAGQFPLVLGGDHSIAMGTLGGIARHVGPGRTGVLWIDAHADFNTVDTSESGNIHGMPLSHIAGVGDDRLNGIAGVTPKVRPENICLVGIRDVDRREAELLKKHGIHVFTMRDIDERGIRRVMNDAMDRALAGTERLHVSLDLDVLDPSLAPGVGTPVPGGITYREAHLAMEMLAEADAFKSFEMVEVNPLVDEKNRTAELAVGLAASAFGKDILWEE